MATIRNMVINDGCRVLVEVGDNLVNILPGNIVAKRCIEKIDREIDYYGMSEFVQVTFKNGHRARLKLFMDRPVPVLPDTLKEFHATCIMVYDL